MSSNVADLNLFKARRQEEGLEGDSNRHVVHVSPQVAIGGNRLCLMAGPCSVESEGQLLNVAQQLTKIGASVIRGGIFKPRTSPLSFQGLGREGLQILKLVREQCAAPVISEILDVRLINEMAEYVDIFQVGSRNMYNYPLLKELGMLQKPVLLKRGLMATVDEFIGAAEYILTRGNPNVILCERGIRSFDASTRFCLDLNVIPVLKERTRLPIIVDPSHGTGVARYVESMSLAAIAAGADGLLIEVHHDPEQAFSDGAQSVSIPQFESIVGRVRKVAAAVGRTV